MFQRAAEKFGRLRRLPREAYYTLTGWRFDDLKRYISANEVANEDASLASLLLRPSLERQAGCTARIAIVSTMPPDETGIAVFMLRHAMALQAPTDIFTRVRDTSQFLRVATQVRLRSGGQAIVHPLSALEAMDLLNVYERVVFVLGNSAHNTHVMRAMLSMARSDELGRCICYLHDPVCHNVVQLAHRFDGTSYLRYLSRLYDETFTDHAPEAWQASEVAVRRGILGTRAIVDAGVRHIVVNSRAAAQLVSDDLSETQSARTLISTLFHPVFPLESGVGQRRSQRGANGITTVGTFGEAGGGKLTDLVVDGVADLRRRGVNARLLVAGYRAGQYARARFADSPPEWLTASEPRTERELQLTMAECDVAVQLRARNLGESSGVVPTLIGMSIPTIVSSIGSFIGYGDAVVHFNGDTASQLADAIGSADARELHHAMAAYASRHSIMAYESAFCEVVQRIPGHVAALMHPHSDVRESDLGETA
jgi:hypothetical protein